MAYNATDNPYLVVWMRNTLNDGKTYAIWGKVLSANPTEVCPETTIFSPTGAYSCWSPRVAWNASHDEYMFVRNAYDISGFPSMTPDNISQQSLYGNGDIIDRPILVIGNSLGNKIYPDEVDLVFANTDNRGKYLWVWRQVKPGTSDHDIWGANVDALLDGYLSGLPTFPINQSTTDQGNLRIATNGANDFMVVWPERSPVSPYDWDIHGREINQIGTFAGDVHIIAGQGATDETDPFVAAWPGDTPRYVVGYLRQSATGQDIWLAYYDNGANTVSIPPYLFWLDDFPAAAYGYWSNAAPSAVIAGPILQMAYCGVSDTPGDHPQICGRTWSPILSPPDEVAIDGPDTGLVGSPYACIAMTSPITYLWQATGQSPVVHVGGFSDSMSFVWDTPGAKTITVAGTNVAGSVLNTYGAAIGLLELFLPIVMRP